MSEQGTEHITITIQDVIDSLETGVDGSPTDDVKQVISDRMNVLLNHLHISDYSEQYPFPEGLRSRLIQNMGSESYGWSIRKCLMDSKAQIVFEDFKIPLVRGNIATYFIQNNTYTGECTRRDLPWFQRFQREYPERVEILDELVQSFHSPQEAIILCPEPFYEVYKVMLAYDEVLSNQELLK